MSFVELKTNAAIMTEPYYRALIPCENWKINSIDDEKKLDEGEKFILIFMSHAKN